uniref:Uncharacterized protein n=1 Tax=Nelumbo nucifera TaxID=4432 RepID=A0A822YPS3_NELNU|nr:TPA_asm: hypothetical protein HUJ06_011876 [Nelumbo nucifera]
MDKETINMLVALGMADLPSIVNQAKSLPSESLPSVLLVGLHGENISTQG